MDKIKYWIIRSLIFIIISLILCFLVVLVYVLIFGTKGAGIFEWFIIGGSGYYSLIFANKISIRITNRFLYEKSNKDS